jgi:hypothetical protein
MTKPKDPKDYKRMGRPRFPYDDLLGKEICRAIATSTDSLEEILKRNPTFPSRETIREWRFDLPNFAAMYVQAKQLQAELFAEEVIDISDDSTYDIKLNKDGEPVADNEVVQRSRLRVDTRKWVACKLAPRLYGDKTTTETHVYTHEQQLKDLA